VAGMARRLPIGWAERRRLRRKPSGVRR